jgi:hypothetical protein
MHLSCFVILVNICDTCKLPLLATALLTYGGGAYIWRRGLHMVEGLTYGGGAYIWWRGLHMVEGLTYGGGAYIRIPSRQQPIEYMLVIYIYRNGYLPEVALYVSGEKP